VNFPIMKYLLSEWPPLSSRGLTGIVGAAALALIAMLQRQSLAVPRKMRLRLVLVSLLAITSWVALMGLALLWLDAREAAVLAISVPVWVALLAWPVLGERLSLVRALARLPAATASIGTLLVPVVGVLSAAAMLHEPLGLRELIALVVALGGVAVALRAQ
jgi:probable blue pigment (indigoidine) exporter